MRDQNVLWFYDHVNPGQINNHAVKAVLGGGSTPFQHYLVVDLAVHGRALVLDTRIQCTQADEFIYHEALVQPAMLLHRNPKKVLVLGGGEGATIREVLRHRGVERCVMVDLDGEVVDACEKWLPTFHQGAFDHPKLELVIGDGLEYLADTDERWDVIISDITEPVEEGPAVDLFTKEFFEMVRSRLSDDGNLVVQGGFTMISELDVFTSVVRTIEEVFETVCPLHAPIPAFGGTWGFVLAGKRKFDWRVDPATLDDWIKDRVDGELRFYDGLSH
ncbi:MAG: fused MFS/spermidine synthase, partial [Myxococcales bacterium]|nr:fused MFS/spermidine synthase [Myxococcales bacterium]